MNPARLYLEIGQSSLKALLGGDGLELPLDREENGRLTPGARARLTSGLQGFLRRLNWQSRQGAYCAIGARGVLLRRLELPPASRDELPRLLALQIESEFPLPPEQLAWGYQITANGTTPGGKQEIVVVAVKKEVIAEYAELFAAAGINAIFTPAALARKFLCPRPGDDFAVLDIGRNHSELITIEHGAPVSLSVLRWGGENLTHAIGEKLGIVHDEAEKLKLKADAATAPAGQTELAVESALGGAVDSLAGLVRANWSGKKLYVSGHSARNRDFTARLSRRLPGGECERLETTPGEGRSAAILGLRKLVEQDGGTPLVIQSGPTKEAVAAAAATWPWKWMAAAAVLLLGLMLYPFAEATIQIPRLEKKLTQLKSDRARLPVIDRELNFLQYVKTNQPPYLDAAFLIADAAPPGMHLETLSMNQHGEIALRGKLQNAQLVTDFRAKLIDTHFFSSVVVEEQTPSPDRQVTVRISAIWRPYVERQTVTIKVSDRPASKSGGSPMPGMPMGMPPDMGMPMPMPPDITMAPQMDGPPMGMPMPAPGGMPPGMVVRRSRPPRPGGNSNSVPVSAPMPMPLPDINPNPGP